MHVQNTCGTNFYGPADGLKVTAPAVFHFILLFPEVSQTHHHSHFFLKVKKYDFSNLSAPPAFTPGITVATAAAMLPLATWLPLMAWLLPKSKITARVPIQPRNVL